MATKMSAGVQIADEIVTEFEQFKLGRSQVSYIMLGFSSDLKRVQIAQRGPAGATWEDTVARLPANEPVYVVTHFSWEQGADGRRSKTVLLAWCPATASLRQKMVFAATKAPLKSRLAGIQIDINAGDASETTRQVALECCQRYNKA